MIEGRTFVNKFSNELNCCYENEDDGVFYTIERFEHFLITLNNHIDNINSNIIKDIKKEDYEVAMNILNQHETVNNLCYFKNTILKSQVVAIYSYLELKLEQITTISKDHIRTIKGVKYYKNGDSDVEMYHKFLISEIIPDLAVYEFEKIINWQKIRKNIVHNKKFEELKIDLSSYPSLKEEFGLLKITDISDIREFIKLTGIYLKTIVDLINKKFNLIQYSTASPVKRNLI
jgi:hypothetical protein